MKSGRFGLIAEYITLFIYKIKLYKILHHRMRNFGGEIDLIARRGRTIIFIEVKARSSSLDDRFISFNQQRRIKKAAGIFLKFNPAYREFDVRFDLVVVKPYKLPFIIKNAW